MFELAVSLEKASVVIGDRNVLFDLSFGIRRSEFVILLGSNGAGKSTLIKAIMGEQPITSGSLHAGRTGLIAQDPRYSTYDDLTIAENCRLRTRKDIRGYLNQFLPQLVEMMDRPVALLSGGERQVLALALCLIDPPDLLLLDEHTSALDPKTADRVMAITLQMVKQLEIATLMTTHNLEHAETLGARILGLRQGQLCFDGHSHSRTQLMALCY